MEWTWRETEDTNGEATTSGDKLRSGGYRVAYQANSRYDSHSRIAEGQKEVPHVRSCMCESPQLEIEGDLNAHSGFYGTPGGLKGNEDG